jgi:FAD/FMN-containing dehydrogenase
MRHILLGIILSTISVHCLGVTAEKHCRCQPNQPCWPAASAWSNLNKQVHGRLIQPVQPIAACEADANSPACTTAIKNIHNPYYIESNPGATQSQGWMNAWKNSPSVYAVAAQSANDVAAAVKFARKYHLKVVVKGTGHDYLGRSNGADSLLIWTHNMRQIQINDRFIPSGCHDKQGIPAITVSAGTRWLEAYGEVTTRHHRYVQGGGCATVGAAGGFPQGGGFGSFSKNFGTGAAGILQAEIVTANGEIVTANRCQNQDLFWAIRGGGAGTFGVVTRLTLKTHPLPDNFGSLQGTITAKNDAAYKKLIEEFLKFYREKLNNEHWGEQFSFHPDNTIKLAMVFQGLNKNQVQEIWIPFKKWIQEHAEEYTFTDNIIVMPARHWWDYRYLEKHYPQYITFNTENDAQPGQFWWTSNSNEVSKYWYTYQSWWLPLALLDNDHIKQLGETFYKASRLTSATLHINKGLAGGSPEAIRQTAATATNPSVNNAAGLIIMSAGSNTVYPGVKGQSPDLNDAAIASQKVTQAMQLFVQAAPEAGTYVNEADYFQKDWQKAFWGNNYQRLLAIKKKYDPDGIFYCHHCVGSELWTRNGMCRVNS